MIYRDLTCTLPSQAVFFERQRSLVAVLVTGPPSIKETKPDSCGLFNQVSFATKVYPHLDESPYSHPDFPLFRFHTRPGCVLACSIVSLSPF